MTTSILIYFSTQLNLFAIFVKYVCKILIFCITEIINKYRMKITKHEEDINDILKQEKEEKEVMDRMLQACFVLSRFMV